MSHLFLGVLALTHLALDVFCVRGRYSADGLAAPLLVQSDDYGFVRMQPRRRLVIVVRGLQLTFIFFGKSEVVQGEGILRIRSQSLL